MNNVTELHDGRFRTMFWSKPCLTYLGTFDTEQEAGRAQDMCAGYLRHVGCSVSRQYQVNDPLFFNNAVIPALARGAFQILCDDADLYDRIVALAERLKAVRQPDQRRPLLDYLEHQRVCNEKRDPVPQLEARMSAVEAAVETRLSVFEAKLDKLINHLCTDKQPGPSPATNFETE